MICSLADFCRIIGKQRLKGREGGVGGERGWGGEERRRGGGGERQILFMGLVTWKKDDSNSEQPNKNLDYFFVSAVEGAFSHKDNLTFSELT